MNLQLLIDHMAWADAEARRQLQSMPPDAPETARARTIYAHIASAEHVWVRRLEGQAPEHAVWPELTPEQAAALAKASVEALRAFVDGASDAELAAEVTYRNSSGREFANRALDIIQHVALHGSYHRGQLALLARDAGAEPVSTDYIAYVRGAPAPGGR